MSINHFSIVETTMNPQSRRDFLAQTGGGFASVALSALLAEELRAEAPKAAAIDPLLPLAERASHFAPKAKQVIFLFQYGGPSTILTALGLNPDDLFFEFNGRQERLTGVAQSWKTIPGVFG